MQVSFLIPVYNTDPAVLTICVNSALKAAGDHHQVVIADDVSDSAAFEPCSERSTKQIY